MKEKNLPHKIMEQTAAVSFIITICSAVLYNIFKLSAILTLAVTGMTVCYHITMRLAVGYVVLRLIRKNINFENVWFSEKKFEQGLYRKLHVKEWKKRMPTYNPDDFSLKLHSPADIVQTMCISELTHEINIILSFVPLLFSAAFNSFYAFMITSVISALFDGCFVIMQRYNRPRMVKLSKKSRKVFPNVTPRLE